MKNKTKPVQNKKPKQPRRRFGLSRKRDIPERTALIGFGALIKSTFRTLRVYRVHFLIILGLYVGLTMLFMGLAQHDYYQLYKESISEFGTEMAGYQIDTFTKIVSLFGVVISGGLTSALGEVPQLFLGTIIVLTWLVSIWLLRQLLAGNTVRVRDGLYNAAAPLISTILVGLFMIVQSIPAMIGLLIFSAATQGSIINGLAAMAVSIGALLLVLASLYWLTSSVFALFVVTLPGSYPIASIRAANELVIGRRLPIMLRLLGLGLIVILIWTAVLVPVLLIDGMITVNWLPLVPVVVQVLGGFSVLFSVTYMYLLYREMINEPVS